jgi:hypothetical protein
MNHINLMFICITNQIVTKGLPKDKQAHMN